MKIAYSSKKAFQKLAPDSNTLVLSLLGEGSEMVETPNTGWKNHLSMKFSVLRPSGPEGSFAPIDDQAKSLAKQLKPHLEGVEKIIIHCEAGEIRSVAVATGIYVWAHRKLDTVELYEIHSNGSWMETDFPHTDTFGGRTYSWISRILSGKDD